MTLPIQFAIGLGIAAFMTLCYVFTKPRRLTYAAKDVGGNKFQYNAAYDTHPNREHRARSTTSAESVEKCCICYDLLDDPRQTGKLKCGHVFHKECILKWLYQRRVCPLCADEV